MLIGIGIFLAGTIGFQSFPAYRHFLYYDPVVQPGEQPAHFRHPGFLGDQVPIKTRGLVPGHRRALVGAVIHRDGPAGRIVLETARLEHSLHLVDRHRERCMTAAHLAVVPQDKPTDA